MTDGKQKIALEKIASLFGTPEGEYGPNLFVSHHLEELDASHWKNILGTDQPDPKRILSSLVLVDSWSSEDDGNIDVLDFSLPENVTNYMLSVRFSTGDQIAEISMES